MIIVSKLYTTFTSVLGKLSRQFSGSLLALTLLVSGICASAPGYADTAGPIIPIKSGTILVFGDSLSAAYGMESAQGWVQLLRDRLNEKNFTYNVINASVSGETTGGGTVRLSKTLQIHQPELLILELGGNDGLRGYPIDKIQSNLATMTRIALESGAKVLLVGMVLPPNYGRRYTQAFEQLFADVADKFDVPLLPYLLQGVTTDESLLQRDGIHPTPEAQMLLLEDFWPQIEPFLSSGSGQ